MTHVSLFSGIGGIDLAAEWAGFTTIAQVERDPYCLAVLAKHWPDVPRCDDICKFPDWGYGAVTLVSGGFPCQPFSTAGKRRGTKDDRHIWSEMLRVIRTLAPRWVLAENVYGLLSIEQGMVFESVLADLEGLGYTTQAVVIPASGVGAPHLRYRVFIVGHAGRAGRQQESRGAHGDEGADERRAEVQADKSASASADVADTPGIRRRKGRAEPARKQRRLGVAECNYVADSAIRGEQSSGTRGNERGFQNETLREFGDSDNWSVEPDVRGVFDGISQRLDGGINGQGMGAVGGAIGMSETAMRDLWRSVTTRLASQGQGPDEQLARELADGVSSMSHDFALAGGQTGTEAISRFLCRMRKALTKTGALRDASKSIPQAWQSLSDQAKDRAFVAAYGRADWESGEWSGVARVATGVKHRVNRLRTLGNAVVPQQVYPILRAIVEVERGGM